MSANAAVHMVEQQPEAKFISIDLAEKLAIFDPDGQLAVQAHELSQLLAGQEEAIVRAFWDTYLISLPARVRPTPDRVKEMIPQGIENTQAKFRDLASQEWADGTCAYAALSPTEPMMSALRAGFAAGHCATINIVSELKNIEPAKKIQYINTILNVMAIESDLIGTSVARLKDRQRADDLKKNASWFQQKFSSIVSEASASTTKLSDQSAQASLVANSALVKATEVAVAAEQSASAMRDAAETTAGLVEAIKNTDQGVERITDIASEAQKLSQNAVQVSTTLTDTMEVVESMTAFIGSIARQTNLLALNATIEAAHAGDYGRGFAVVAQEVKLLSQQTSESVDQIRRQTIQIREAVQQSVASNTAVHDTVREVGKVTQDIKYLTQTQIANVVSITAAIDETAITATTTSAAVAAIQQKTEMVSNKLGLLAIGFTEATATFNNLQAAADTYVQGEAAQGS